MATKLKTEMNTVPMERRVRAAAKRVLGNGRTLDTTFEHGQWWVSDVKSGAQWSVVDSTGPNTYDGFGFEQVTGGDEK